MAHRLLFVSDMLRTFFLAAAVLFTASAWLAPHARADLPKLALRDLSTSLDPSADQAELSSIDGESTAATVLYVTGVVSQVLGVGVGGLGFIGALLGGGPGALAMAIGGLVGVAVGFVAIGVAIGLDVDSGSRRRGLRRRQQEGLRATPYAAPTNDGFSLGLAGTF